ncbi:MAG TPA: hypothetical protein VK095_06870 [Beutenbergiaceae bacterium]|nr:hypothetical protein [Beutenbergiaceae bacterium]
MASTPRRSLVVSPASTPGRRPGSPLAARHLFSTRSSTLAVRT